MVDDYDALESSEKALLDTEELGGFDTPAPDDGDKVELDLDDAPFLEDDEEEEEETEQAADTFEDLEAEPRARDLKALLKDRRVQGGLAAGFLIILLAFLLWPEEDPPEIVIDFPDVENATLPPAAPPPPPPPPEFVVPWEPFWVEHVDEEGRVRFLFAKFSAPTNNEKLAWEIRHKNVVLRDAIFYYLRNKDLTFLADKENVDQLKRDLLSVVNQYLGNDQLNDILIEDYLVK